MQQIFFDSPKGFSQKTQTDQALKKKIVGVTSCFEDAITIMIFFCFSQI
jgi:hypothetical protein